MPRKKSSGGYEIKFEEISNPILPKDWKRVLVKRQTGKTKDLVDIYVIAPGGKKLRSSREFLKHLAKTKTPCNVEPDKCVDLFKRGCLKAENFDNQNLLIKLVPSLANEAQRENMGIVLPIKRRGRPKRITTDEDIDHKDIPSKTLPTSRTDQLKENSEKKRLEENSKIGFQIRKRGRPKKVVAVENIADQNQLIKSGNGPQEESLGMSIKARKRGRPKKNSAAENIANPNKRQILIPTLQSQPLKKNLGISTEPRKRGRPKSSAAAKHFVLINHQSYLVSTLGKEQKVFKRRKRRGRPKSINLADTVVSSINDKIEEKITDQHETRADKSVQTDDFLFTFRNESNNVQSYNCIDSQDNLRLMENAPTNMIFTTFETGDVGVSKRFTYLPSSISKMKWDSVSGSYAIDVDGKVIPSVICNDEEYSRLENEASDENSFASRDDVKDICHSEIVIEEFEDSEMCNMDSSGHYIIDNSCAVTICHRPKTRQSTWIPPKSPYNIIQQMLYDDPWKLLISTFFEECHDPKHFWEFIDKWPSAKQLLRVNVRYLADFLQDCGIHRLRAGTFLKFTDDFLHTDWVDPKTLFGIRNFGRECYILFYLGEWKTFKPKSGMLKLYLNWYNENFVRE